MLNIFKNIITYFTALHIIKLIKLSTFKYVSDWLLIAINSQKYTHTHTLTFKYIGWESGIGIPPLHSHLPWLKADGSLWSFHEILFRWVDCFSTPSWWGEEVLLIFLKILNTLIKTADGSRTTDRWMNAPHQSNSSWMVGFLLLIQAQAPQTHPK